MIVRAKTPKGLSWAGRIAVLGMAALFLPLAPSWAQNNKLTPTEPDRLTGVGTPNGSTETQPSEPVRYRADQAVEDRVAEEFEKDPEAVALRSEIDKARDHFEHSRSENQNLTQTLNQQLAELQTEIETKRELLKDLYKKGKVAALKPQAALNPENRADSHHVQGMMNAMVQTDLALIETQSMLDVKREAYKARQEGIQQARQGVDAQLLAQIEEVFKKDPEVLAIKKEIDDIREHLDRIKRNLRQPHDAARVAAQNHFDKLRQEYNDLWESKFQEILDRLTGPAGDKQSLARIQELEQKVDALKKVKGKQAELFKAMQIEQKTTNDDTFEAGYLNYQLNSLLSREDQVKKRLEQLAFEVSPDKDHVALVDPAQREAEKRVSELKEQYQNLWTRKHDQLLAALQKDKDDAKDDDKKEEKTRDAAERLQEQLKDLIAKLGKELSPVAEEVRKALEQAVGEVHKSLEKDGLSAEELGKALERSQENLRKAFEGGGPVDKELREAIEKGLRDMEEAFDRARGDAQDQVESLRQRSRELRDQARENFERARGEAERRFSRDGDEQPNRDELESARKEIRDLQQQLQRATRRLDELQRRESRRDPVRRREPNPQPEPQTRNRTTPRAEPATPEPPNEPGVPATPARPARPNVQRPLPPMRPGPGAGRRGPQIENDKRLHELEDKMNRLLEELKNLKDEKSPKESK